MVKSMIIDVLNKSGIEIKPYINNNLFKLLELNDLICYETCNRNNLFSLAIWMNNTDFVRTIFVPTIIKDIEWLSSNQIKTMFKIITENIAIKIIVINFDENKKIIRLYFNTKTDLGNGFGYDINVYGIVEKYKEYKSISNKIITKHYMQNKLTKMSESKIIYKNNHINIVRDDGQLYILHYK